MFSHKGRRRLVWNAAIAFSLDGRRWAKPG
jgi:hypothetical protein